MARRGTQIVSDHYPFLPIQVQVRGDVYKTDALADTGFDGALVIPERILMDPRFASPDTSGAWSVADGRNIEAPVYYGSLEVVGMPQIFPDIAIVALGNQHIVGRRILDQFSVAFDHGEIIVVKP